MDILDHEANLGGQGSIKSRIYRGEWKFKIIMSKVEKEVLFSSL